MEQISFWNVPKQIQNKRRALNDLVLRDKDGNLGSEINKLRKEINVLLDSEEIMWHQRAKVHWMNSGDRNTEYFHSKALDRRKKNTIYWTLDENENWCESIKVIADVAVSYFEKLYTTSHPNHISEVIGAIPARVTLEMNQSLIKQFNKEEVETALKQMHSTKAPGLDGMFTKNIGMW